MGNHLSSGGLVVGFGGIIDQGIPGVRSYLDETRGRTGAGLDPMVLGPSFTRKTRHAFDFSKKI